MPMMCKTEADIATVEQAFLGDAQNTWNQLRNAARRHADAIGEAAMGMLRRHAGSSPSSCFALLLDISAKNEPRRSELMGIYRALLEQYPAAGMAAAGYNLHEYQYLLSIEWMELSRQHFAADPTGAWGIIESAALYRNGVLTPDLLSWFLERRAQCPRSYFISFLSLCDSPLDRAHEFLPRTLAHFADHPLEAIAAASFVASNRSNIIVPAMLERILALFPAAPEQAWEFFKHASERKPEAFDASVLDALCALARESAGEIFAVLHHLIVARRDACSGLLEQYSSFVRCFPEKGVESAKYHFQTDCIPLIRPHLIEAICAGMASAPYSGYEMLQRLCDHRPELIRTQEIDTAIANIEHASNYAFGFFTKVISHLPEHTSDCMLALFDCLAREPVHRAFMRAEELETIITISEAAQFRTGLERAMREPVRKGSRRARALMVIMFRQKLRSHRHLLLEALRYAGTMVMTRKTPIGRGTPQEHSDSQKYSPIWDFLMFIIDHSGDDANSTAAAERFLEGTFQLQYLYNNAHEHHLFLAKLDLGYTEPQPLPRALSFLGAVPGIQTMYDQLHTIARRFDIPCRIAAIEDFMRRQEDAQIELSRLRLELAVAAPAKRKGMLERERRLDQQLSCWRDPRYLEALGDPTLVDSLAAADRPLVKNERKNLIKNTFDSLHGESVRVANTAVDRLRLELYRLRVKEYTDYDVDISTIDSKVLPAFLWFGSIKGMPKNTRYLRRLIEDRLTGREHDWLRSEPAAASWAAAVTQKCPQIRLERWRAPFAQDIHYRAKDSRTEKEQRIAIDLAQTRRLLEQIGARDLEIDSYEHYLEQFEEVKRRLNRGPAPTEEGGAEPTMKPVDAALIDEIAMNLERIRITEKAPESDFEGRLTLSVESDPFEILFMGEYGFSSCLSLRGSNAWSAVSNAIDIDKTVVWAKEPAGNVVGRRLLALTPEGLLAYNTYTNKNGLSLHRFFDGFIDAYASHCGTIRIHEGHPRALLSDRWYDDGCI